MKTSKQKGFTIVELLIVIVVIAILAAISVVAYNGIQQRVRNSARISEVKEWEKIIKLYIADKGVSPLTTGYACLGTGFPDSDGDGTGDCWDVTPINAANRFQEDAALNARLAEYATLPNATRDVVKGTTAGRERIGPVLRGATSGDIHIYFWLEDSSDGPCPFGAKIWSDNGATISCRIAISQS